MPVKINTILYEKGKKLRKAKFWVKCYERRGGGIERVFKTIEEAEQVVRHYFRNLHKVPCYATCPFCAEIAKEATGTKTGAGSKRGKR